MIMKELIRFHNHISSYLLRPTETFFDLFGNDTGMLPTNFFLPISNVHR